MHDTQSILAEDPLPLAEVAELLPRRRGRKVSRCSLWRWATRGLRPRGGGPRVVLQTAKIGGTRYSSAAAVARFAAALDGGRPDGQAPPAGPGRAALRGHRAAMRFLERAGYGAEAASS